MGIIGARQQKFHRLIQRHLTLMDYELIGSRFKMSPRSIQGIAQGRRNNVKVLLALFEVAKQNMQVEYNWMNSYEGKIERLNEVHFEQRELRGFTEDDADLNESVVK